MESYIIYFFVYGFFCSTEYLQYLSITFYVLAYLFILLYNISLYKCNTFLFIL